jgi:glycosyltransferase involved in cell wall biosynthesis
VAKIKSVILFFHTGKSSFSNKDLNIFVSIDHTIEFTFSSNKKILTPFLFVSQFFVILKNIRQTKIFISQFAGYHSFIPSIISKIFNIPHLIISGGTDCVSFPGIGYGNFSKLLLGLFTKWSYQLATHISPKHESLWFCKYTYEKQEPSKQGISAFIPKLNTNYTVINNGYDPSKFLPTPIDRKQNSFLTVCGGFQFPFQIELKGIDLILEVARHFPKCTFTILGVPSWKKLDIKSNNVVTLPPSNNEDLVGIYSNHQFYMQLSMAEGFPNALCEAMLCGCIPIVSNVFSMPEIIENTGFILKERNIELLKELVSESISESQQLSNFEKSKLARQVIINNYHISKRNYNLKKLIFKLIDK